MGMQLIQQLYLKISRSQKRLIFFSLDILVLFCSLFLAFFLRLELFLAINDFILHWRLALFLVFVQIRFSLFVWSLSLHSLLLTQYSYYKNLSSLKLCSTYSF